MKVVVDACGSRTKLADDAALGSLTAAGISLVSTGAMLHGTGQGLDKPGWQGAIANVRGQLVLLDV